MEPHPRRGYHAAMELTEPKGRITIDTMVDVIRRVEGMGFDAKLKAIDQLAASQPNALGCALVLPTFDVPMPVVDHVLHVVLVIAEAVKETLGGSVPLITLDMIERSAAKHGAMVRLLDGETKAEARRLTDIMTEAYPERNLFAYVTCYMKEQLGGPSPEHERAIFAVATVLDAFVQMLGPADADRERRANVQR
ncbi:MAG: hypothetical protein BIFFINMI_03818 [Phycisphaerae bacterium]|nr:hypothetical protein [Phycisphaerae bacterium]